ncbi:Nucleotide-binding universal stress protein, UspA family [Formosa sp. Hel1_31_208]|uniref:universal stress protein n=1 Tax=Formosa sp. Hel1_31_208 TaxID=1798225 RepID=UPI000879AC3B|nr:universal stress protein [Formosa sp. Hel1_31_208]SDS16947.1 Nucleotide-binding universal stress protein, UspA family [Formosa sp. Hel1_31_208]
MKKILLPTDFSENSMNAIHYAMAYFESEACTFYILNVQKVSAFVTDDLMAMQPSETIFNSLVDAAKQKVGRLIREIQDQYHNELHQFESKVDYDNFIDAINQLIALEEIDLIVMGTKGASNIAMTFLGSNAARVIQRANCPVLAIPNDYQFKSIERIAFPSNYFTDYNPENLKPLLSMAERDACTIDVLHVKDGEHLTQFQENNRAFLDASFSKLNHSFIELEQGNLFKKITNYILEHDIDLLAMMSRKHSFLERLFVRHPAESFAFDLKVPLLVMENTGNFYIK